MGRPAAMATDKKQLHDVAFSKIYNKIITLEYEQGQILYEKQLIQELGIGRTPIREALLRLAANGLVDSNPNNAFVVSSITLQNIKAVFESLEIMERGVIELAVRYVASTSLKEMADAQKDVERAMEDVDILGLVLSNYRFHMAFYRASRNEYLVHGLKRIRFETKRMAYLSYSHNVDQGSALESHYETVRHEHGAIMQYLKDQDEESLHKICRKHNKSFHERIVTYLTT
jgi:DNA-binding GntR family transcriptional regulator